MLGCLPRPPEAGPIFVPADGFCASYCIYAILDPVYWTKRPRNAHGWAMDGAQEEREKKEAKSIQDKAVFAMQEHLKTVKGLEEKTKISQRMSDICRGKNPTTVPPKGSGINVPTNGEVGEGNLVDLTL